MANWTIVEGKLSDWRYMGVFLAEHDGRLWSVSMSDEDHKVSAEEFLGGLGNPNVWKRWQGGSGSGLLDAAEMQISNYFAGRLLHFDLPLEFRGTGFQVRVWKALQRIPFGTTQSYGDVAQTIGQPQAMRAVGGANGRNNLPLFVPCHRVIAAGGKLGGFSSGLGLKRRLLAHETTVLGDRQAVAAAKADEASLVSGHR